ncbi:MAG: hypothetical protein HOA38_00840 [Candidatus Marinimicrobia bacterium]|jgi:hypothetical protein|nr:hypothetical protein [Candidatus Neomarinimicrobiota bacterium]
MKSNYKNLKYLVFILPLLFISLNAQDEAVEGGEAVSPLAGFSIGLASTPGLVSGETFTDIPVGFSVVLTTPYGISLENAFDFTFSVVFGQYSGNFEGADFSPSILGVGGNLTIKDFIFAEGHLSNIGAGLGMRGFAGVSSGFIMEKLKKSDLNLPFNLLVGGEGFISSEMVEGSNPSFWGGLGVRLDYNF